MKTVDQVFDEMEKLRLENIELKNEIDRLRNNFVDDIVDEKKGYTRNQRVTKH